MGGCSKKPQNTLTSYKDGPNLLSLLLGSSCAQLGCKRKTTFNNYWVWLKNLEVGLHSKTKHLIVLNLGRYFTYSDHSGKQKTVNSNSNIVHTTSEVVQSAPSLAKGGIYKVRQHFFRYFWHPTFQCQHFPLIFDHYSHPPLKSADVLYGRPQRGLIQVSAIWLAI